MNLKETSGILNVSANTVKLTRSKLKKKLNISSKITLKEYLELI